MSLATVNAFAETSPDAGKHYSVYLLAGQSTTDGCGDAKHLTGDLADYAKPHNRFLITYSCGGHKRPLKASDGFVPLKPGCTEREKE